MTGSPCAPLLAVILVALLPQISRADSDTLAPISFRSFSADFSRALKGASIKDALGAPACLGRTTGKRIVCTYKVGNFMSVMLASSKDADDPVEMTMICIGSDALGSAKCLLAYSSGMAIAASSMNAADRAKILAILVQGLSVGNEATISTDDRKFSLQKSIGIWLNISASDEADRP